MMSRDVWKFGSRWSEDGDPATRIADSIFKKYNVAFAASDDVMKVKKGDLIEIGDSDTVIAIGEALSDGESINQFGLAFVNEKMKEYLVPDAVYGCTVHYYWLSDDEKFTCKTGRFHSETLMKEHVNKLFDNLSKK